MSHENLREREKYVADEALAGCTTLAVLAAMHERAGGPSCFTMMGPCYDDSLRIPVADWLARHVDAGLNSLLLRLVSDEEMEFDLRDTAAVALCRGGNDAVLPTLIAFVADGDRPESLRTRILHRLPRIGGSLGPEIEALLSFPFRGLDDIAAAALALAGDNVAPSLVRDALADPSWSIGDREHLLVRAVEIIARSDREIVAQARVALHLIEANQRGGSGPHPPPPDQAIADLVPLFTRWLDTHPEARTSRFERERETYRNSDRYRREQKTLEAEEPWKLPDEDFDLAAALTRVDPRKPDRRGRWLDALDRMAVFLRREIGDATDPDEVLGILHRLVLSGNRAGPLSLPDLFGPPSYLERVLEYRSGNCLGWTSLYLALADRLDLPLVPVSTPNHVFVRWDDGKNVLDVELTALGLRRDPGGTGREAPRVFSRREVVARLYLNRSFTWRTDGRVKDEDRYEKALFYADRAVAWAPGCLDAHTARVQAFAALDDPGGAARAAEEAIAACDADPASVAGITTAGDVLFSAGDPAAALEWYDRAIKLDPEDGEILRRRLFCLELLGKNDDLIREATAFLAGNEHRGVRLLRLGTMARIGDDRWRGELKELEGEGTVRWLLRMNVAEILLGQEAWEDATRLLDGLSDLDVAAAEAEDRKLVGDTDPRSNVALQQHFDDAILLDRWGRCLRLRTRALDAAGNAEAADALRDRIPR